VGDSAGDKNKNKIFSSQTPSSLCFATGMGTKLTSHTTQNKNKAWCLSPRGPFKSNTKTSRCYGSPQTKTKVRQIQCTILNIDIVRIERIGLLSPIFSWINGL